MEASSMMKELFHFLLENANAQVRLLCLIFQIFIFRYLLMMIIITGVTKINFKIWSKIFKNIEKSSKCCEKIIKILLFYPQILQFYPKFWQEQLWKFLPSAPAKLLGARGGGVQSMTHNWGGSKMGQKVSRIFVTYMLYAVKLWGKELSRYIENCR